MLPYHVTQWVKKHPWNETTEYNARRTVYRAFSWALEEGLIAAHPLKGMKRPQPLPRQRCLSEAEFRQVLAAAHGPFRVFVWALRQTGARPSELRRLTWDQVRYDRWVIATHKTVRKTGKPRIVHLTAPMQRLVEYLRRRSTSPHVFVNTRGEAWTTNALRLQMARIKTKCGLAKDVCAYLIRHAYGTQAIVNGVDPITVAELMGHQGLDMINKVYVHLGEHQSHLQHAAEKATQRPAPPKPPASEPHRGA